MPPPRQGRRILGMRPLRAAMLAGFLVLIAVAGISSIGTTSVSSLGVGDCFESPGFGDITRVNDQDCDGPHEAQIYAVVEASSLFADEPCLTAFLELDPERVDRLPDDAEFGALSDDATTLCLVESPSGQLVGSLTG